VLLGLSLFALLYTLAITRWRAALGGAGHPFERWRALSFYAALVFVLVSLNGPLHDLSDLYLFSTHMIQHLVLAQVFPLLFVLGIPTWLWKALLAPRFVAKCWHAIADAPMGFILYTVVFSLWHFPVLYDQMMRDHNLHIVMHLLVMATAVLMWWPIAGGGAVRKPLEPGAQMLYLFLLGTPMMAVAAMVTLAGHPLYQWYALAPRFMGMSALEDQRLGGLIMWVPGGMFFWGIMTVVYFRWAAAERSTGGVMVIGRMPERST
jgi:putative membrane protein